MSKRQLIWFSLILALSGIVGGFLSGTIFQREAISGSYPTKVMAQSFQLVDGAGRLRGGIGFDEDGVPLFFLNDKNGATRAYLATDDHGPFLVFRGQNMNTLLMIGSDFKGRSSISLMADKDKKRLVFSYLPKIGPVIGFFDENNIGKAFMGLANGKPSITLLEKDKQPAIALLNKPGVGSVLSTWDSQGNHKMAMGLYKDKPIFYMYDKYRTGLLFNMQASGRPALALMQDGSPIWSATGAAPPPAPDMTGLDDIMRDVLR